MPFYSLPEGRFALPRGLLTNRSRWSLAPPEGREPPPTAADAITRRRAGPTQLPITYAVQSVNYLRQGGINMHAVSTKTADAVLAFVQNAGLKGVSSFAVSNETGLSRSQAYDALRALMRQKKIVREKGLRRDANGRLRLGDVYRMPVITQTERISK